MRREYKNQKRNEELQKLRNILSERTEELTELYIQTGRSRNKITEYLLDLGQFNLLKSRAVSQEVYLHMQDQGIAKLGKRRDNVDQHQSCLCGKTFTNFAPAGVHRRHCGVYQAEVSRVSENIKSYIVAYYQMVLSVSECISHVREREETLLADTRLRPIITDYLKSVGEFKKFGDPAFEKSRQQKAKQAVFDKFGVENVGMLPHMGWNLINKIPATKITIMEDVKLYRERVSLLTKYNLKKIKMMNKVPDRCHYTGVVFSDVRLGDKVNPNDPLKRTVDHVVSINEAFFRGWSPEQTADFDNLVFCIRIANTLKHNTSADKFMEIFVPVLKNNLKEYIDESESD